MIKVSVIIPVYNAEKYIEKCLDSVINQTLKEIEIICIDDCSTDNSHSILERYKKIDNRIVVLRNETNQGIGKNRNIGIKKAVGEYLAFIDNDDFYSPNFLYDLFSTSKKYNSDISYTNTIFREKEDYNIVIDGNIKDDYVIDYTLPSYFYLYSEKGLYSDKLWPWEVWGKIWRKDFLIKNNITFINSNYFEDLVFLLESIIYTPNMSVNNNAKYYNRKILTSAGRSKRSVYADIKNYTAMFDRIFNIYYEKSYQNIGYALDRFLIELYKLYDKIENKEIFYRELSNNMINIVLDRNNVCPVITMLKNMYNCLLNKKSIKEFENIFLKYKIVTKIFPQFILKQLRKNSIIL
ncbi:glycosyltransferase family 2 protein [Brachyspira hyodysenteriae]|uniref:Glycosyl transferase family 2 protein n=1 Tax=Brachyspira hyodysenteriae (strain ATCC 49526 / WA1) TaxID=565034 RepID=A0A3B6V8K9_BRAHW|nr:glycosyltransferase family 2 protein [Brachyspira hyodysenteriae]ACN83322.1 putative glycosyl transferase family 2 protein [Brachyspira hyodysenteriae WA1]KLI14029.1 glycosyl transferase family 2 [Brachyspira hyodysenteriae]KLI31468.1 glycosyl transferase family 2 [Brachyspira hyodysenteriae]KLI41439.1 glycosyl transferase family 2 [Brachyspira hyodysenteriae]KLI41509.1 glycosyl transferase family 2 [Brachyspira hyodysenteriae]